MKSTCLVVALALVGCTGVITDPIGSGPEEGGDAGSGPQVDADPGVPDARPLPEVDGGPVVACGDGDCGAGESCGNCASDCGACSPTCGDGVCGGGESCASCGADCGSCAASCGDALCDGRAGETCTGCGGDCNTAAMSCGNGECQEGETSLTCRVDCGPAQWQLDWAAWEEELRVRVNAERAAGTDCPNGAVKEPAGPLAMNAPLRAAARLHSWDMSQAGYFDHTSCNGRSPWARAAAQGTSAGGEVIGWNYQTPAAMVAGWLASPGHCAILMNPSMSEIGVGLAAEGAPHWTGLLR